LSGGGFDVAEDEEAYVVSAGDTAFSGLSSYVIGEVTG
jgi:hypothetical protein